MQDSSLCSSNDLLCVRSFKSSDSSSLKQTSLLNLNLIANSSHSLFTTCIARRQSGLILYLYPIVMFGYWRFLSTQVELHQGKSAKQPYKIHSKHFCVSEFKYLMYFMIGVTCLRVIGLQTLRLFSPSAFCLICKVDSTHQ